MLQVGSHDLLLDPCCGTGTILVGALERGARAVGCDQAFKFSCGTRANLDRLGFDSVGGGALRSRGGGWEGQCAVARHDAREPFAKEFAGMTTQPTVVVSNVPHGRLRLQPTPYTLHPTPARIHDSCLHPFRPLINTHTHTRMPCTQARARAHTH